MSSEYKSKDEFGLGGQVENQYKSKDDFDLGGQVDQRQSVISVDADIMDDAVNGENREHGESLWAAVKSHPWACFWAFTMCFTIVSLSQCTWLQSSCLELWSRRSQM